MLLNIHSRSLTSFAKTSTTLLAVVAAMTACGLDSVNQKSPSDVAAISNRPNYDRFIAIVKLKSPALLADAKIVDGKPVTDADLQKKIEAEQKRFIEAAKKLSPDVRVIFQYKLVLNAVAIVAPIELQDKFQNLVGVSYVTTSNSYSAPQAKSSGGNSLLDQLTSMENILNLNNNNSTSFIGALRVQNEIKVKDPKTGLLVPVTGAGVRVGIIDTGIDYTHAMFNGAGTAEAYKAINPSEPAPAGAFPSGKIVGGIDLVGTKYNSDSPDFEDHIPKPDSNPLDEGGHGTHVAGTVAGHGNGTDTYNGVAPDASLYAIKVFGANGNNSDDVIIAALEFAADPNQDMNPEDRLDVVNMSLGENFGFEQTLYSEAVKNLSNAGTVNVISAGNSGFNPFIVGYPGTSSEAVTVAASIDNMDHNWKFSAVRFSTSADPEILAQAIEGSAGLPIAEAGNVEGKLVFIGNAATDLTEEQAASVKGNIALIDRGAVNFQTKVTRAEKAGAIGVVVADNTAGRSPIAMSGDGTSKIPAIMITKELGDKLKADPQARIAFVTDKKIETPEIIDTLTSFSSQGPRSIDALIKPEVSAPGYNVISAAMGKGKVGVKFSGTSMAAPHVTGVAALFKQIYPASQAQTIKSLIVNTAKSINDASGHIYPVSQMGAGRVQAFEGAKAGIAIYPQTLSLGIVEAKQTKKLSQTLTLENLQKGDVQLQIEYVGKNGLAISGPSQVTVNSNGRVSLPLNFELRPEAETDKAVELDGFVKLSSADGSVKLQVPVLALTRRNSIIKVEDKKTGRSSASYILRNTGTTSGLAYPFNLIATDEATPRAQRQNRFRTNPCDLESAGYKVVKRNIDGKDVELLQIGVKVKTALTNWHHCDISVLIDANNDGVAEQELVGTHESTIVGSSAPVSVFGSYLLDAKKTRDLRKEYEAARTPDEETVNGDYSSAILDDKEFIGHNNSTIAILSADLSLLALTPNKFMKIKIGTGSTTVYGTVERDDFLNNSSNGWFTIQPQLAHFQVLPESIKLDAKGFSSFNAKVGAFGVEKMVIYYPQNYGANASKAAWRQSEILP